MRRLVGQLASALALTACLACSPAPPPRPTPTSSAPAPQPSVEPLRGRATTMLDLPRNSGSPALAWSPTSTLLAVETALETVTLFEATGAFHRKLEVPGELDALRFSDDGRRLLTLTPYGAAAFDAESGQCVRFFPSALAKERARFSPRGDLLAILDLTDHLHLFGVSTGAERWSVLAGPGAKLAAFAVTGEQLIGIKAQASVVWEVATGAARELARPPAADWAVTLAPDARAVVFVSPDQNRVILADAATGAARYDAKLAGRVAYLSPHAAHAPSVARGSRAAVAEVRWSADGKTLALLEDPPNTIYGPSVRRYQVVLVDVATGKAREVKELVVALGEFGADGRLLYAQRENLESFAIEVATGLGTAALTYVPGLPSPDRARVASLVSKQDDPRVVVNDAKGTVVFEAALGLKTATPSAPVVKSLAFAPRSLGLAFGGAARGGSLAVWDVASGGLKVALVQGSVDKLLWPAGAASPFVSAHRAPGKFDLLRFDDAGQNLARLRAESGDLLAASEGSVVVASKEVHLLTATGSELAAFSPRPARVAVSADGQLLALNYYGRSLAVHDAKTGLAVQEIKAPTRDCWFLPNGRLVAREDDKLELFDPRSGAKLGEALTDVAESSSDGRMVLSRAGQLVDLISGARHELGASLRGDGKGEAALSNDGRRVAVANAALLEIVEVETGKVLRHITPTGDVSLLAFSSDGQWLVGATSTGVLLVRVDDGRSMAAHLVDDGEQLGRAIVLDSGHFDGDRIADAHLRVWTETGLARDTARAAFARETAGQDFFTASPTAQ